MSIIKLDKATVDLAVQGLKKAAVSMDTSAAKVEGTYQILTAEDTFTNVFSKSLLSEISQTARKMEQQKERMSQYAALMGTVTDILMEADTKTMKKMENSTTQMWTGFSDENSVISQFPFSKNLSEWIPGMNMAATFATFATLAVNGNFSSMSSDFLIWVGQKGNCISNIFKMEGMETLSDSVQIADMVLDGLDIMNEISSGNADMDTFWKAGDWVVDAVGLYADSDVVVSPLDVVYTTIKKSGKYVEELNKYEDLMLEAARDGEWGEVVSLAGKSFIDTVGKGIFDVGTELVCDVIHADMISELVLINTGIDIGAGAEKVSCAIEGFVDQMYGLV